MTLTLKDGTLTVKQDMAGGQFTRRAPARKRASTPVRSRYQLRNLRFDFGGRYEQVRRISTMTQDRLEDHETAGPCSRPVPPDTAIANAARD